MSTGTSFHPLTSHPASPERAFSRTFGGSQSTFEPHIPISSSDHAAPAPGFAEIPITNEKPVDEKRTGDHLKPPSGDDLAKLRTKMLSPFSRVLAMPARSPIPLPSNRDPRTPAGTSNQDILTMRDYTRPDHGTDGAGSVTSSWRSTSEFCILDNFIGRFVGRTAGRAIDRFNHRYPRGSAVCFMVAMFLFILLITLLATLPHCGEACKKAKE